jgi:hypothetical protein
MIFLSIEKENSKKDRGERDFCYEPVIGNWGKKGV